jgi:hypothetical protein
MRTASDRKAKMPRVTVIPEQGSGRQREGTRLPFAPRPRIRSLTAITKRFGLLADLPAETDALARLLERLHAAISGTPPSARPTARLHRPLPMGRRDASTHNATIRLRVLTRPVPTAAAEPPQITTAPFPSSVDGAGSGAGRRGTRPRTAITSGLARSRRLSWDVPGFPLWHAEVERVQRDRGAALVPCEVDVVCGFDERLSLRDLERCAVGD